LTDLTCVVFEAESSLSVFSESCFAYTKIPSIFVPKSVHTIRKNCFSHCRSLSVANFEQGTAVQSVERWAFLRCDLRVLQIPASLTEFDGSIVGLCPFSQFLIDTTEHFTVRDDFLLTRDGKETVRYFGDSVGVTVPASVHELGRYAFSGCLTCFELDFSESTALERIGRGCFQWSSLRSIVIPRTVTELGRKAFAYCYELIEVGFDEPSSVVEIGEAVFIGSTIEELKIPASVSRIHPHAFDGCRATICIVNPRNSFYVYDSGVLVEIETGDEIAFFGPEFCI
jgi:hypothetical protein